MLTSADGTLGTAARIAARAARRQGAPGHSIEASGRSVAAAPRARIAAADVEPNTTSIFATRPVQPV